MLLDLKKIKIAIHGMNNLDSGKITAESLLTAYFHQYHVLGRLSMRGRRPWGRGRR